MFEPLFRQLKADDVEERRQAIIALANSRNPVVLKQLAAVFRSDPDPALRELALKAGRYIRQYAVDSLPPQDALEPPPAAQASATAGITERDRTLAKGFLDAATTHHLEGDKGRAIDNLGKALSLNPELQREMFVVNLVMTLTNMAMEEALPLLTHPDRRRELVAEVGGKRKLRRGQELGEAAEMATWDNVLIDFVLYAVVMALGMIAVLVFTLDAIREMIEAMPATTVESEDLDAIFDAGVMPLLIMGGYVGISSALSLALQGGAIHVAAIYILGGDGTLVGFYRRLVPFQTIVTLIFAGMFVFLALGGSAADFWFLTPVVLLLGSLVAAYKMAELVGRAYNFGVGAGCGAILLGGVLLWVVTWFGNVAVMNVLGRLLGTG